MSSKFIFGSRVPSVLRPCVGHCRDCKSKRRSVFNPVRRLQGPVFRLVPKSKVALHIKSLPGKSTKCTPLQPSTRYTTLAHRLFGQPSSLPTFSLHCFLASLFHCFIASLLHCFIASLLHCFIALLLYCFIASKGNEGWDLGAWSSEV